MSATVMYGRLNFFVQLFYHTIRKTESLFIQQIFWADAPVGDNDQFSVYCTITYCGMPDIVLSPTVPKKEHLLKTH